MKSCKKKSAGGFSIVELMIGSLIGMLVVGSVVTVWSSFTRSYRYEQDLAGIQESGRFVVEALAYDIRMTGYFGCAEDTTGVGGALEGSTPGSLHDIDNLLPLEGRERGGASWQETDSSWKPSNSTAVAASAILPGTDAITLRFLSGERYSLANDMATQSEAVVLSEAPDPEYKRGLIVGVSDCAGADIFPVAADTGAGTSVAHSAAFSKLYEADSFVHAYTPVRYFIGTSVTPDNQGRAALMRETLARSEVRDSDGTVVISPGDVMTEVLLEGVENLQFLYGEDTTGTEAADVYRTASAVVDWSAVRTIRLAVLLASTEESGVEEDAQPHTLLDVTIPAEHDRRRRRVFSATVQLRNNR